MILRRLQQGQSVIEFALVLPLFLLLVIGMCYIGMIMADYLTLSNIARSSAREFVIRQSEAKVRESYKDVKLPFEIFKWQATNEDNFKINYDKNSENVKVTLKADLNTEGKYWRNIVNRLTKGTSLPKINIEYNMYTE